MAEEFIVIRKDYRLEGDPYSASEAFLYLVNQFDLMNYDFDNDEVFILVNINVLAAKFFWSKKQVENFLEDLQRKKMILVYGNTETREIGIIQPYLYLPNPILSEEFLSNGPYQA